MLTKALPEHFNQPIPMSRFFRVHFLEHLRRRRIRFPQRVRKLPINPAVFFLRRNRQRQDFPLAQILEFFQHRSLPSASNEQAASHKGQGEVTSGMENSVALGLRRVRGR